MQVAELDGVLYKEIVEHGLREFPNEACGLLAGRDGQAVRFYPMRNADASPATYRLDPREQLQVFEELEREGLELFGIVHSHTHSEPYPSETDRRQAFYPESLYLILGLADRERPVLRAFRIVEGEVTEEELRIG
ncbi:MAG TPA: M67 family metallopeptidase [Actinomycetota bacterium]|nr:M67 family metallopeptidase [Actinomycetota bacterium]